MIDVLMNDLVVYGPVRHLVGPRIIFLCDIRHSLQVEWLFWREVWSKMQSLDVCKKKSGKLWTVKPTHSNDGWVCTSISWK